MVGQLTDLLGADLAHLDVHGQPNLDGTGSAAVLSGCGAYRYLLTRTWDDRPPAVFVMHNPSTADGLNDDPTIRRCIGFAKRETCGGLIVVNAYAARATNPQALADLPDPYGPDNLEVLLAVLRAAARDRLLAIAAWGCMYVRAGGDYPRVLGQVIASTGVTLSCLGVTAAGHPRHPLYLSKRNRLIPYTMPGGQR